MPCYDSTCGGAGPVCSSSLRPTFHARDTTTTAANPHNNPGRSKRSQIRDLPMKAIVVVILMEYVLLRPMIIRPENRRVDFIGFVACYSFLGFLGRLSVKNLSGKHWTMALRYGMVGAVVGFAWLLFYVGRTERGDGHLLAANLLGFAGLLCGIWMQRRAKAIWGQTGVGRRL